MNKTTILLIVSIFFVCLKGSNGGCGCVGVGASKIKILFKIIL